MTAKVSARRVVALVGATAVGKTAVAVRCAEEFDGEIVSLDSRQMYRRLDIGTAKPSADERARAPHHLVDVAEPDEALALSDVQAMAYAAIDDIARRDRLPIVAGGTGQYVRAVLEGWSIPRVPPDAALRAALTEVAEVSGAAALHDRLASVDPVAAARIDPRNVRRVVRALEVYEHTGEPFSAIRSRAAPPFESRVIGLDRPRAELYARIDARIDGMLAAGLEEEVRGLVDMGCGFDLPAMSGVGYGEWREYFGGAIDVAEVTRLIRRNTRRLVRMQGSWFKRGDTRIEWFDLSVRPYSDIAEAVAAWLAAPGAGTGD